MVGKKQIVALLIGLALFPALAPHIAYGDRPLDSGVTEGTALPGSSITSAPPAQVRIPPRPLQVVAARPNEPATVPQPVYEQVTEATRSRELRTTRDISKVTAEDLGASGFAGLTPPYGSARSGSARFNLLNNDKATNPTWQELLAFLEADRTDQKPYIQDAFMCGEFAEELHNSAEANGIRAAWVAIDFTGERQGHALNAFETTDRGLVFVDVTGEGGISGTTYDGYGSPQYDRIAYLTKGNEYGLISLRSAAYADYAFYEEWQQLRQDYEGRMARYQEETAAYGRALGGKTLVSDPDQYAQLKLTYDGLEVLRLELEGIRQQLGSYRWQTLGIVTKIEIYW
ncbi:MAG: hypothetical protein HY670_00230 [Chloroflexi bacterium]|nr:hypothetical protein [Chloroflexota bacterium]